MSRECIGITPQDMLTQTRCNYYTSYAHFCTKRTHTYRTRIHTLADTKYMYTERSLSTCSTTSGLTSLTRPGEQRSCSRSSQYSPGLPNLYRHTYMYMYLSVITVLKLHISIHLANLATRSKITKLTRG